MDNSSEEDPHEFRHDLIIAADDGCVYHIKRDHWQNERFLVDPDVFAEDDGWAAIRDVLNYGVNLATVPPQSQLPGDRWKVRPLGTCYVVNIDSLKTQHRFLLKKRDGIE